MNMIMGMNLGQTLGGQLNQQAQPVSPNQTVPPVQPADPKPSILLRAPKLQVLSKFASPVENCYP